MAPIKVMFSVELELLGHFVKLLEIYICILYSVIKSVRRIFIGLKCLNKPIISNIRVYLKCC